MSNNRRLPLFTILALLSLAAPLTAAHPQVNESARQIPIAYEVDVVVVGGSTGAVAAAVTAAQSGQSVFLAAGRPYLGDDMTATLRLWREEDEEPVDPLAAALYHDVHTAAQPDPRRIPYTYRTDLPSAHPHEDTSPPKTLIDGAWGDPIRQSVQYDGDATVTADLAAVKETEGLHLVLHKGAGPNPYKVGRVTVRTSDDSETWSEAATIEIDNSAAIGNTVETTLPFEATARYLQFAFQRAPGAKRILLGEIEIIGPTTPELETALAANPLPRPMHVKRLLDEALLTAGVKFLYGCLPTDVLHDDRGELSGIVIANRAGRQAVLAKTIIDATNRASVARIAGARFRPFPPGNHTVERVVIGGELVESPNLAARQLSPSFRGQFPNPAGTTSGSFPLNHYTLTLPFPDDTVQSWSAADQTARTVTYHPEQQFTSDALLMIPPGPLHGRQTTTGPWQGADALPLDAFRPDNTDRLWVLGPRADVSRPKAERLLRPANLIQLGRRIGSAAADEAAASPSPAGATLRGRTTPDPSAPGDTKEFLAGVRPVDSPPTVPQQARAVPVLGRYDVVVIGGGTAGAPAGIGAARRGAKTLVVEYLHALGGVGTTGAISKYYYGNRVGFTTEVPGGSSWVIEQKQEWYRTQLLRAGADVWLGTIGCGAFVHEGKVTGAVVASPHGRGIVLADVVIDATGNSDVAAAAGAECRYTGAGEFAMQGTGLPPRQLGATYTNTDYTYTDEADLVDVWHLQVYARQKFSNAFDLGQLVDTRERRQIVGDFTVTLLDQMAGRTFPDTIVHAMSNYDTHGHTISPVSQLKHPLRTPFWTYLPYRCLLPQNLEGILVSGIGISAHRDAQPLVRMQPDVQNQGYAAGVAAAITSETGRSLRDLDVRALQRHLVDIGNIPAEVLDHQDSFPASDSQLSEAVESIRDESQGLPLLLAHPDRAIPLLQQAHNASEGRDKLAYAKILGMLGDRTGLETLIAAVRAADQWDEPPRYDIRSDYPGYRDVGWSLSALDNTIIALGRTHESRAVPVILEKLALLEPDSPFSHYRSTALALSIIADPRAAEPLANLLLRTDMTGHTHLPLARTSQADSSAQIQSAWDTANRTRALRELALARALYLCGDHQNLAQEILTQYTHDLRGHFARHAQAVLDSK